MSRAGHGPDATRLRSTPRPWNSGRRTCTTLDEDDQDTPLPAHVDECTCQNHDGVCTVCGYKITVGPSGTEYGHARRTNRVRRTDRDDCPHRPDEVDNSRPGGEWA